MLLEPLIIDLIDDKVKEIMQKLSVDQLAGYLRKDKKTVGNTLNFAVLEDLGKIKLLPLNIDASLCAEIEGVMNKYFSGE